MAYGGFGASWGRAWGGGFGHPAAPVPPPEPPVPTPAPPSSWPGGSSRGAGTRILRWYRMGILGGELLPPIEKCDPAVELCLVPEPIAEPAPPPAAPIQAAEVTLIEAALVEDELDEATRPADEDDVLEAELDADLTPPPRKA